jgi:hypothetical protein
VGEGGGIGKAGAAGGGIAGEIEIEKVMPGGVGNDAAGVGAPAIVGADGAEGVGDGGFFGGKALEEAREDGGSGYDFGLYAKGKFVEVDGFAGTEAGAGEVGGDDAFAFVGVIGQDADNAMATAEEGVDIGDVAGGEAAGDGDGDDFLGDVVGLIAGVGIGGVGEAAGIVASGVGHVGAWEFAEGAGGCKPMAHGANAGDGPAEAGAEATVITEGKDAAAGLHEVADGLDLIVGEEAEPRAEFELRGDIAEEPDLVVHGWGEVSGFGEVEADDAMGDGCVGGGHEFRRDIRVAVGDGDCNFEEGAGRGGGEGVDESGETPLGVGETEAVIGDEQETDGVGREEVGAGAFYVRGERKVPSGDAGEEVLVCLRDRVRHT